MHIQFTPSGLLFSPGHLPPMRGPGADPKDDSSDYERVMSAWALMTSNDRILSVMWPKSIAMTCQIQPEPFWAINFMTVVNILA